MAWPPFWGCVVFFCFFLLGLFVFCCCFFGFVLFFFVLLFFVLIFFCFDFFGLFLVCFFSPPPRLFFFFWGGGVVFFFLWGGEFFVFPLLFLGSVFDGFLGASKGSRKPLEAHGKPMECRWEPGKKLEKNITKPRKLFCLQEKGLKRLPPKGI